MRQFFIVSESILPTLIQKYDKRSFHFWSSSKTRLTEILQAVWCHILWLYYIHHFSNKKCLFLTNMEPLNFMHFKWILQNVAPFLSCASTLLLYMSRAMQNRSSDISRQRIPRLACAARPSDQGLHFLQTESLDTKKVSTEQMSRWDCPYTGWSESTHSSYIILHI